MTQPPSERSTVRRGANRAEYDPAVIRQILDAGALAHVGVVTAEGPVVLPMAYGRSDTELYLHGSVANAMLRAGSGVDICATVTIVDGLVIARSPFHNSMNYRSVVVRGTAQRVEDPNAKLRALKIINDHIVATWETARPPSELDVRQTLVLAVSLDDAAAKVRTGDPVDDPADYGGPWWAGVIPMQTAVGPAINASDLGPAAATEPPPTVVEFTSGS